MIPIRFRVLFVLLIAIVLTSFSTKAVGSRIFETSWTKPIDITGGVGGNNSFPSPICDSYQNMHLLWADSSEEGLAIFYQNDVNGYWSSPNDILYVPIQSIYYLSAIIDPSDTIHLVFVNLDFNSNLYYSHAPLSNASNPRAWASTVILANNVVNPTIGVDSQGIVHIIYAASSDGGLYFDIFHFQSNDGGSNWTKPAVIYSIRFPQPSFIQSWMAIDERDRIHIGLTLRSQEYGLTSEVGYLRSQDGGNSWDPYITIDDSSTTFQGVAWLAPYTFEDDEIHLTWHDPRRMHQWSLDGGITWSTPNEIMALGAAFGGPNDLVKDSHGNLHVVTAISDGVFSAEWLSHEWGPPQLIDNRYIDPHGQRIIACQGNQLHVFYYDRTDIRTIWYSNRQLDAPQIARQSIPQPTIQPNINLEKTLTPGSFDIILNATPTNSAKNEFGETKSTSDKSQISLMFVSVIPAIFVIIVIIVTTRTRNR
jgi:hypothetical protein